MSLSNIQSNAEDLDREIGAITMKLAAEMPGDLSQQDLLNLSAECKDAFETLSVLVEDTEAEYEELSDKVKDGNTGGRYLEILGELEDAQSRLEDGCGLLSLLCTGLGARGNVSEAVVVLEGVSEILDRAAKV